MGTIGEKLRQARERSNRTIREMSDLTKIRGDHLEALEAGDYHVFAAPVYIRGFARSYAAALKLPVAAILAELEVELGRTDKFKEPPRLTGESKGVIDLIMLQLSKVNWTVALPLLLLALILVLAFAGYRIYQEAQRRDPLKELGPGLYQPPASGEILPFPSATNR